MGEWNDEGGFTTGSWDEEVTFSYMKKHIFSLRLFTLGQFFHHLACQAFLRERERIPCEKVFKNKANSRRDVDAITFFIKRTMEGSALKRSVEWRARTFTTYVMLIQLLDFHVWGNMVLLSLIQRFDTKTVLVGRKVPSFWLGLFHVHTTSCA